MQIRIIWQSLVAIVALAVPAQGAVDLVTLPTREGTQLTIYNSEDITIHRRLKDQKTSNVVVRQYKRRLDDQFVLYYDLIDYDETLSFEEEIASGKPVAAKTEVERQFDANVVLWGPDGKPKGWNSQDPGAYAELRNVPGRVERVDQQHVKYFLDLQPGKKQTVSYSVTYKRRKVGPELNTEKKREPLWNRSSVDFEHVRGGVAGGHM